MLFADISDAICEVMALYRMALMSLSVFWGVVGTIRRTFAVRANGRTVTTMTENELFGNSEQLNDTISRQAAIEALDKRFDSIPMEQTTEILLLRKDLRNLPSAQPQRMRGKWTYGEDEYGIDGYHCDKCGFFVPWDYTHKFIDFIKDYHFCPNCGADMRGEQDEY